MHLPDGSEGELRGEAVALSELPGRFAQHGSAIVETARRWRGTPYLWGGTTPAGADCSGLVQAVFRTHGIELPRDSDQQARVGVSLDIDQSEGFDAGDLLFFAEQQNRISHVAISTGHWKIIHSAVGNGGVREDDLSGDRGYERELRNLLVGARRLVELNG